MKGSEKQIEWATKILRSITANAAETKNKIIFKIEMRCEKRPEKAEIIRASYAEDLGYIDEVFSYAEKVSEASRVIDLRLTADKASEGMAANWREIATDVALMAGIRL
ncbi:MAG TPA: hypothetical protein PLK94_05040 [Alphaproteobacteria bacterium]|nr:hypothetical protein [Alphaproteobacteria bacterium]